jgi:hypothetical protein
MELKSEDARLWEGLFDIGHPREAWKIALA